MVKKVVVVTGAAGYIGSSLIISLAQKYSIIAIDKRNPTPDLIAAAPGVRWIELNIADPAHVNGTFHQVKEEFGKIDFIIHLAAYYHFGDDWRDDYEKTNINGTENIINAAIQNNVRRIIFASSVAAMEPPSLGKVLNERTPVSDFFPYARSKSVGEKIIKNASTKTPAIILRLGGVFSDWCELPPLYGLIQLWSGPEPFSRIIPGKGTTGIPYIHISDVIQVIQRCILLHDHLGSFEIFIASQRGAVVHNELYPLVKQSISPTHSAIPIYFSPSLVKIGLQVRLFFESLDNQVSVEQPWMLQFIDRPWTVDNAYTQQKLNWRCKPDMHILKRLSLMLKLYQEQKVNWMERKRNRLIANYKYIHYNQ